MRIVGEFRGREGKPALVLEDRYHNTFVFVVDEQGYEYLLHRNTHPFEYDVYNVVTVEILNTAGGEIYTEKVEGKYGRIVAKVRKTEWPYDECTLASGYVGYLDDEARDY